MTLKHSKSKNYKQHHGKRAAPPKAHRKARKPFKKAAGALNPTAGKTLTLPFPGMPNPCSLDDALKHPGVIAAMDNAGIDRTKRYEFTPNYAEKTITFTW